MELTQQADDPWFTLKSDRNVICNIDFKYPEIFASECIYIYVCSKPLQVSYHLVIVWLARILYLGK